MKKLVLFATVASLGLSACGSTDDANAPAEADSVEMPADEVMAQPGMDQDAAVAPAIGDEMVEPTVEETEAAPDATTEAVADDAAAAADDLTAAMNEEGAE